MTAALGPTESAVVAFVRASLRRAQGTMIPLGEVFAALRKVVAIERVSLAVLERMRDASRGAPAGAGGPFTFYGAGAEDVAVDLAKPGFRVQADDDPNVARVLGGAPAVFHPLDPAGRVDRTLWLKGIRSTMIVPLKSPEGVVFATLNAGSTVLDGLTSASSPLMLAVAEELRAPVWRALAAASPHR